MKRIGNLWPQVIDRGNILFAIYKASKGKRDRQEVKRIFADLDYYVDKIREMLISGSYKTSKYRTKKIYEPKERTLYKLPFFPDRIIHHCVMNIVAPLWQQRFIEQSYACIVGRGTHSGSAKCMEFVRCNDYCLKADISKFYPSIRHDLLFNVIKRKIKDKNVLSLLHEIIFSFRGERNVPIGNYPSMWFGNLFLNELDMFVKHELKCRYYIRYCDDFVLFSNDKAYLHECKERIKEFVEQKLDLTFSKYQVFPVSRGIDYLGYRHFRNYKLLRKSTVRRLKRKVTRVKHLLQFPNANLKRLLSVVVSYEGILSHCNSYRLSLSVQLERLKQRLLSYERVQRL